MPSYAGASCDQATWDLIRQLSWLYEVPFGLALAVSRFESDFDPAALGDNGESCSLFQLYSGGFAGNIPTAQRCNPTSNAELALKEMRRRYDSSHSWWDAIQPWSVRPVAFPSWVALGDPEGGFTEGKPKDTGEDIGSPQSPSKPSTGSLTPISLPSIDTPNIDLNPIDNIDPNIALEYVVKAVAGMMLWGLILFGVYKLLGEGTVKQVIQVAKVVK